MDTLVTMGRCCPIADVSIWCFEYSTTIYDNFDFSAANLD